MNRLDLNALDPIGGLGKKRERAEVETPKVKIVAAGILQGEDGKLFTDFRENEEANRVPKITARKPKVGDVIRLSRTAELPCIPDQLRGRALRVMGFAEYNDDMHLEDGWWISSNPSHRYNEDTSTDPLWTFVEEPSA